MLQPDCNGVVVEQAGVDGLSDARGVVNKLIGVKPRNGSRSARQRIAACVSC